MIEPCLGARDVASAPMRTWDHFGGFMPYYWPLARLAPLTLRVSSVLVLNREGHIRGPTAIYSPLHKRHS